MTTAAVHIRFVFIVINDTIFAMVPCECRCMHGTWWSSSGGWSWRQRRKLRWCWGRGKTLSTLTFNASAASIVASLRRPALDATN